MEVNEQKRFETGASYQKRPGRLIITNKRLYWSPNKGEKQPIINIPHAVSSSKCRSQWYSNLQSPGFAKNYELDVYLKVAQEPKFKISTGGAEYTFSLSAWDLIPKIQSELTTVKGRSAAPSPVAPRSAAASPAHQRSSAPSPASGSSSPALRNGPQKVTSKTGAPSRNSNSDKHKLCMQLLLRDKNLSEQHRTLVLKERCVTEDEFWELRQDLLRDHELQMKQKKGRSSVIPNIRPITEEGGETKINITPQLVQEIFDEYPRVKIAYEQNVGDNKPLGHKEFWKRYVQSRFNDRNRSNGSSVVNDDLFERCWLETEEDLNQEREHREHGRKRIKISNLRDLSATKEDHMEVELVKDITMRSGQGKILSLIRRSNRHGERILETSSSKTRISKEKANQNNQDYTPYINIEDLIDEQPENSIRLEIHDQREYFASQKSEQDRDVEMIDSQKSPIDILNELKADFVDWRPNLTVSLISDKSAKKATKKCNELIKIKQNYAKEALPNLENFPSPIEKEVHLLHLMGNEYLRHFWASMNSKDKAEKNKKMIEKLRSALARINKIKKLNQDGDEALDSSQSSQSTDIRVNELEWSDATKLAVQMLKPLRDAIETALRGRGHN
ncbi:12010_t:CDS:10 [Dentiscutata erythropus]|uniref:12010_t:CDS:1 n=1 Tax=Dentiscutata erythropus TaxID=1348616 RepID=A0A9N9HS90_9GLOM|nr:12010_t:CDS:10 [Dentiscutata erythropus]